VRSQNRVDTDVEQIASKFEHEQARLYSGEISNPKEQTSIQEELDALRRRKAHLEDQELEVMEQRETVESEATALASQLAELDAAVGDATSRRDTAATEIEKELAELTEERARLVPTVHPDLLDLYETVRPKYGGIAVGALDRGTCRACGLPVSPMSLDEIRRSDAPIIRCENCRRLLVPV
jgi:hypothetical protein